MDQYIKTEPIQRLTIRDREEVMVVKKAIKLLLENHESQLSLSQQMRAIEVYHKAHRSLLVHD